MLAGRSWKVTYIDWKRRQVFVEVTTEPGRARWESIPGGASFAIARGVRSVLLGSDPAGVHLTQRAAEALADIRALRAAHVRDGQLIVSRDERGDWRWWTFAGERANRTLVAWADPIVAPRQRIGTESIRLRRNLTVQDIREGIAAAGELAEPRPLPSVDTQAVQGLKFSAALPVQLASRTLSSRVGDPDNARVVLDEEYSFAVET